MPRRGVAWPEALLALGVLVLACVIAYQLTQIRVAPIYAKVGPRLFPGIVAAGLAAVGLVLLYEAWRGGAPPPAADAADPAAPPRQDLRAGLVVAGGFLLQVILYEPAGFVLASAVGFLAVAFGFGSRRYLRDLVIGLLLSEAVYLLFALGLGLRLPKGLLAGLP